MTSEIRTNSITSRAGLSTVTMTDSGPMFSGITTFVDNSTFSVGTGGTIHAPATNTLNIGVNNTESLRIDSNSNLKVAGIVTATHFYANGDLDVDGHTELDNVNIAGVTTFGNNIFASGTSRFEIASMENALLDGEIAHTGDTDTKIRFPAADTITAETGGTERLRIGSSGEIHLGTSNWPTGSIGKAAGRVMMGNEGSLTIWNETNSAGGGGTLKLACKEGSDATRVGFVNLVGGTENTSDRSSFFKIQVSNSSGSGIERLRITSGGQVNIGHAISQAPWDRNTTSDTGVRLANSTTGYAIAANSNEIVGIFNKTATGTIVELKYNGTVITALGNNFNSFGGQQNTFRYDNGGGMGPYLSLQNRGSGAATATGIAFGCGNSDASMTSSDYGEAQIKVYTDSGLYGNMEFNVHTGANRSYMKIVGNGQGHSGAGSGTEGMRGGVAFGNAGVALDRSWTGQPGLHVFNQNVEGDTDQATFRFHGWNRSYTSYPDASGSDFGVSLIADGMTLTSDRRRKTDITTITGALDTVSQMRGVSFTYVNRSLEPQTHMSMDNGKKLGFIAQEVIPLLPELILDSGEKAVELENGYCDRYNMDYGGVTPLLVEAIKELKTKIETLEQDNIALRARVTNLEGN